MQGYAKRLARLANTVPKQPLKAVSTSSQKAMALTGPPNRTLIACRQGSVLCT